MELESLRRELRILRFGVACSLTIAAITLIAATTGGRNAVLGTLTVHRINVIDNEGHRAMVITNHDDFPPPIVNGKPEVRKGGDNESGIVFYNQMGNEQGALLWDGVAHGNHSSSGVVLSYDTADTDQLMQMDDLDDNGTHEAYLRGWSRVPHEETVLSRYEAEYVNAKSAAQRAAVVRQARKATPVASRFFVGYAADQNAAVILDDAKGKPRVKLFVTPGGKARLQFLNAAGRVVDEYPK